MPQPRVIANTAEFSVRCFKPLYAEHEEEYTPWFFGHAEEERISDDALMEEFETWKASGGLNRSGGSPASGFADYLEERGYIVFFSPEEWCWILPVTREEEQECLDMEYEKR